MKFKNIILYVFLCIYNYCFSIPTIANILEEIKEYTLLSLLPDFTKNQVLRDIEILRSTLAEEFRSIFLQEIYFKNENITYKIKFKTISQIIKFRIRNFENVLTILEIEKNLSDIVIVRLIIKSLDSIEEKLFQLNS